VDCFGTIENAKIAHIYWQLLYTLAINSFYMDPLNYRVLVITFFGFVKRTLANKIAKIEYKIVTVHKYHEPGLLIENLTSPMAATKKCRLLPMQSGFAYIPPISTDLAIQFIIANPRYNAPMICTIKVVKAVAFSPIAIKISDGKNEAVSPANPVTIVLEIIKYFVFICGSGIFLLG